MADNSMYYSSQPSIFGGNMITPGGTYNFGGGGIPSAPDTKAGAMQAPSFLGAGAPAQGGYSWTGGAGYQQVSNPYYDANSSGQNRNPLIYQYTGAPSTPTGGGTPPTSPTGGSAISPTTGAVPSSTAGGSTTQGTSNPWSLAAQQSAQQAGQAAGGQATANFGQADNLRNAANVGYAGASQVMNTAFDPQNALYNRTLQQVQDQQRVGQSARGITSSPYGAGLENQALSNFNIDWQNNQLGRQVQGLQGYATGLGAGREAATGAGNLGQMGVGQTQAVGQTPWDTTNQQQQQDLQNWIAYENQRLAGIGAQQVNYPLQNEAQSYRNFGSVPYISGGNNFNLSNY